MGLVSEGSSQEHGKLGISEDREELINWTFTKHKDIVDYNINAHLDLTALSQSKGCSEKDLYTMSVQEYYMAYAAYRLYLKEQNKETP